jgi:TorA maturation chaperone TorD
MSRRNAAAPAHGRNARIAAAAEWRLIGLLLERPRADWHEEIAALGGEVRDMRLRAAARAAQDATEGAYLRVLGPGGQASPREVAYRPFEDPGQILAGLSAIYGAFAFQPRTEEPLDHIAVEAGFVGYLLLKEAFAQARGDAEAAATTAAARRAFVETHLAPMTGPFAQRLETAGQSYLAETARLLAARVPARRAAENAPAGDAGGSRGSCSLE